MSFTEENVQVLNLMQTMIGAITPNFRRITLELITPKRICLHFVLEYEDSNDREEIDEIGFEFEALQEHNIELDIKVIVDGRSISEIDLPGRLVYGRKES